MSEEKKKVKSRNECQIIESIMDPIMVYGFLLGVKWTHCKECGTKFIIMVIIFQTRHKVEDASPITCHHYRSHGTFYKKSRVILAQIQILLSDDLYFLCSMPGRHYGFFLFETVITVSTAKVGSCKVMWGKRSHIPACGSSETMSSLVRSRELIYVIKVFLVCH